MPRLQIQDLPVNEQLSAEQQDDVFGAGLRRRRLKEFHASPAEVLEARQMLSATAMAVFKNNVLTVTGTDSNDTIRVKENQGSIRVSVNGKLLKLDGNSKVVSAQGLKKIVVNGLGGNDVIDAKQASMSTRLVGGQGNDRLFGGKANDLLIGGGGRDQLHGFAGEDVLKGGGGNDKLRGGADNDRLLGGGGGDLLDGQAGKDSLLGQAGNDRLIAERDDRVVDGGSGNNVVEYDNNEPSAILLSKTSIGENADGAVVGIITVKDADQNDTHSLQVSDDRFEIVNGSLKLKTGVSLDHEAERVVRLDVTATDQGGLSKTERFEISVTNVNETPTLDALKGVERYRDGGPFNVDLNMTDPDGNVLTVQAQTSDEGVTAVVSNGVLTVTPAADFVGKVSITVLVTDGLIAEPIQQSFELVVRGSRAELVAGVLTIRGTSKDDDIQIETDPKTGKIAVLDGKQQIGEFNASSVKKIQVEAGDGSDVVDLTSAVVDTWVFAGGGNDQVKGGSAVDHLFGMGGVDQLFGFGGNDVLYGGEGQFDADGKLVDGAVTNGGVGADFVSLGTGRKATGLSSEDTDIESMSYEDQAYFDLIHKFRDAHGFVIAQTGSGIDQLGDAVIFTGLAVNVSAMRGDVATTLSLLQTLKDKPFVNELGRERLIRHPDVWDHNADLERDRHAPLTKDGVVGVISAVYYAFKADGMTAEVRALAKEVAGKYIDYLIANNWLTIDRYPDHYWDTEKIDKVDENGETKKSDKYYFKNVFSETGGRVMAKGPEAYLLAPNDRYALQNVAAEMGFVTSQWSIWGDFGATIGKSLGDAYGDFVRGVADDVAGWAGEKFDAILRKLAIHEDYSFHVIPGLDWTLVKGDLDLEISSADRGNIVGAVEGVMRETVKILLGESLDHATEIAALTSQMDDFAGRLVDKILDALPSWLSPDSWRPLITDTVQQIAPWMTGGALGELIAFKASHELAKEDNINAHLSFWPTLMMYETRPEMADILSFSVENVDAKLNANKSSDFFDKDASKMDMMLYAWLAGEEQLVGTWLHNFENDKRFDNLSYAWKKDHKENVEKVEGGDKDGFTDSGNHRMDYLLLKSLERHGVPKSASEIGGEWVEHWKEQLQKIGLDIKAEWDRLRSNLGAFAKKLQSEFDASIGQVAKALFVNLKAGLVDVAKVLKNDLGAGLVDVAVTLRKELNAGLGEIARLLKNELGAGLADIAKVLSRELGAGLATVAVILRNEIGAGIADIAITLRKELSAGLVDIAKILRNNLFVSVVDVAVVLRNNLSAGLADIAKILRNELKAGLGDIAKVLNKNLGASLVQVAGVLRSELGAGLSDIAKTLYKELGAKLKDVAYALWKGIGGLTRANIANALWYGIGGTLTNIANALWYGVGGTLKDIATGIWKGIGGITRTNVAYALWKGISGLSRSNIAYALWHGIGGTLTNIANALWYGVGGTLKDIANGIWKGIGGITRSNVAYALWKGISGLSRSNIAYALWHGIGGTLTNIANALWYGVGGTLKDIANGIWKGIGGITRSNVAYALWKGISGLSRSNIAYALWHGIGGTLTNIANALWYGVGGTLKDIANGIWKGIGGITRSNVAYALWKGISGLSRSNIAYALWHGIGGTLTNIANALWYGIGGTLTDVASALWKGISGINAGNVAYALWHGIKGLSTGNIIYALQKAIGLSYASALSIARSL